MACAVVWSLQHDESEESVEFQKVLVRFSGKRLKRGHSPTAGSLLTGYFVVLQMLDYLDEIDYDIDELKRLKATSDKFLPGG